MKLKKKYSEVALKANVCYEVLGGIGAILVIWGYYLNANYDVFSWLAWIIGNLCVGVYCFFKKAYSTAVMSLAILLMNIYGYLKWTTVI